MAIFCMMKMFTRVFPAALLLLAVQLNLGTGVAHQWAQGIEGQRKADLGNGTYLNPIFPGDHPDPSILKDGRDYYIVFSTFRCSPTPPQTRTDGIIASMNAFGRAEDVGWAATYLCASAARFVTGVMLPVDGGVRIGF
jgi:hypothetical protein